MTNDPSSGETPAEQPPLTTDSPNDDRATQSPDLVNELREMGQQLETMFRTFIESDRAKQLQRDLTGGVQEITKQVQLAVKSAQDNPRFQQAEERGRQMLSQAQQSKFVNDVQETLISGINQLNQQLRRASERMNQENQTTGTTTQQVPIEVDETKPAMPPFETFESGGPDVTSIPGATGDTQQLDIDVDDDPTLPKL